MHRLVEQRHFDTERAVSREVEVAIDKREERLKRELSDQLGLVIDRGVEIKMNKVSDHLLSSGDLSRTVERMMDERKE